ncbi:MAG: hypothetical protein U0531_10020 [Dehalococcoidia bacterium]
MKVADGEITVEGLTLDQDMRWSIAVKNVALALLALRRGSRPRRRDPSDRGQRAVLRAEDVAARSRHRGVAARPGSAAKATAFSI